MLDDSCQGKVVDLRRIAVTIAPLSHISRSECLRPKLTDSIKLDAHCEAVIARLVNETEGDAPTLPLYDQIVFVLDLFLGVQAIVSSKIQRNSIPQLQTQSGVNLIQRNGPSILVVLPLIGNI